MNLLDLNEDNKDNIDITDISFLNTVGYEIIDCDALQDDNLIQLRGDVYTQRAIELTTKESDGSITIWRYSRGSHKQSYGFREKYNVNDFVYNSTNKILIDSTNGSTYFYKEINRYSKEIQLRFKMLEKAYRICFPHETCTDGTDISLWEKQYLKDIKSINTEIGYHNYDLMMQYQRAERDKLEPFKKIFYMGNSIEQFTFHATNWEPEDYNEKFRQLIFDKSFSLGNLIYGSISALVLNKIVFCMCTLYLDKSTQLPVTLAVVGYKDKESGLNFYKYGLEYNTEPSNKQTVLDDYDNEAPVGIKIIEIKHRPEDIEVQNNVIIDQNSRITNYIYNKKAIEKYIVEIKQNYTIYNIPEVIHINTFEKGKYLDICTMYNLEDTPIEYRDHVMAILAWKTYSLSNHDYDNLLGFQRADRILTDKRIGIKNKVYNTAYNERCLTWINYVERKDKPTQKHISNSVGYL